MSRETADYRTCLAELEELLRGSDLSEHQQRSVRDAIVSSLLEGAAPDRGSMVRLIAFAAGRISFAELKQQVLQEVRRKDPAS